MLIIAHYNKRLEESPIKKELTIFLFIFLIISFFMHQDAWQNAPIKHIKNIHNSSLGIFHPLYLILIIYLIVLGIRKMIAAIVKRVRKKNASLE